MVSKKTKAPYPFLFVGEGFATSRKCLEGYLWFQKPPPASLQEWILDQLPIPVWLGVRFEKTIMHYGSDDALELYVKAAYSSAYKRKDFPVAVEELQASWERDRDGKGWMPTKKDWAAFCDHFERGVRKIHTRCPLLLVVKPDDGEYGLRLGPWHAWSIANAHRVAELAVKDKKKPSRDLSYLAANLVQDVLAPKTLAKMAKARDPAALHAWLSWLDKLVAEGARDLRVQFVHQAARLLEPLPPDAREAALAGLRTGTRKAVRPILTG